MIAETKHVRWNEEVQRGFGERHRAYRTVMLVASAKLSMNTLGTHIKDCLATRTQLLQAWIPSELSHPRLQSKLDFFLLVNEQYHILVQLIMFLIYRISGLMPSGIGTAELSINRVFPPSASD